MYIVTLYAFIYEYMKMSEYINETTRHLKVCYISILTNLLRTRRFVRIEI